MRVQGRERKGEGEGREGKVRVQGREKESEGEGGDALH